MNLFKDISEFIINDIVHSISGDYIVISVNKKASFSIIKSMETAKTYTVTHGKNKSFNYKQLKINKL